MSDDVAEGGKRQRNDSCGSLSFEEEAHYKTQPTDQVMNVSKPTTESHSFNTVFQVLHEILITPISISSSV